MPNTPAERRRTLLTEQDRTDLAKEVTMAILAAQQATEDPPLGSEERRWVRGAIAAQIKQAEFRENMMKRGFIWGIGAFLTGAAYLFVDWLKTHGFKTL